jgi:hypothetical protein
MPMHIFVQDKNNIISYLNGYSQGRRGECTFLEQIREWIEKKYRVSRSSDGWWGQLSRLAKKQNKCWEEVFGLIALEILEPTANTQL